MVVYSLLEFVPSDCPFIIPIGEPVVRFDEEIFAERERDNVVEGVECLIEEDNGRFEGEIKREWAAKELERRGIVGGLKVEVLVLLNVGVVVEPWKAIVVGFRTARDDAPFVVVVGWNGVIEIFSLVRDEEWVTVIGKVAERARRERVCPFGVWSFDWIRFVDIMDV